MHRFFAIAFSTVIAWQSPVLAQGGVGSQLVSYFVDIERGSNATGTGSPQKPFATITAGIAAAQLAGAQPAVVVINPGIYSESIVMIPGISLHGTNAINTVLFPAPAGGDIITIGTSTPGGFDETVIANVNVYAAFGGSSGVLISDDNTHTAASSPTFANCLIADTPSQFGVGAGVTIASTGSGNGVIHRPKFINCTFRYNDFGILNGTSDGGAPHEPGVLNTLFVDQDIADMVGMDSSDLEFSAWDTGPSGTVFSPAASLSVTDWVEDQIFPPTARFGSDPRLVPGAATVDAGSAGLPRTWMNGTTGIRVFPNGLDIWATDCEGFCNPRFEDEQIDIGADELGSFIVGGYQPLSTEFTPSFSAAYVWANPSPSLVGILTKLATVPTGSLRYLGFGRVNRPIQTQTPAPLPPLLGLLCLGQLDLAVDLAYQSLPFSNCPGGNLTNSSACLALTAPTVRQQYSQQLVLLNGLNALTNLQTWTLR